MKRYVNPPGEMDLSKPCIINAMYSAKVFSMPQFLCHILVMNRQQYDTYYKSVIHKEPNLEYEHYLQLLAVFLPVDSLIARGLIDPDNRDFYQQIHNEYFFLNFDRERAETTLRINPEKVFKRYVEVMRPVRIWDKTHTSDDDGCISAQNEDVVDSNYYSVRIENYFFN